jgi:predicted amidophosphoribosyltransferase
MFLDVLLPQRCVVCSSGRIQLCDACRARFPRIRGAVCERCGAPTAWPVRHCRECAHRRLAFVRARAALAYDESVRAFVAAWKERGLRRLAPIAPELVDDVIAPLPAPIAFVPADPDRRLRRGHHPAAALARELASLWERPLLDLLSRRSGRRQRGLSLAARRANVRGAFSCGAAPRRVVLVDDVYTSGSTVDAAARALRRAGARQVDVVTFARAVRGYYSETRT